MYSSVIVTAWQRRHGRSLLVAALLLPVVFKFCGFFVHSLCLVLAHRDQSACVQW